MPRTARPRWKDSRSCWVANIGEKGSDGKRREVQAPREIGPGEEARAWEWFGAETTRREKPVVNPDRLTVANLGELHLEWAESRINPHDTVVRGLISRQHYQNKAIHQAHINNFLGKRIASTLQKEDMTRALREMAANYKPTYCAGVAASASALFNWAVTVGHLTKNPIAGYESPVIPRSPERFAERKEIAAFLGQWRLRARRDTVNGRYMRLTMLAIRTLVRSGARPRELCRLWWTDMRWTAGRMAPDVLVRDPETKRVVGRELDARPQSTQVYAKATLPPERWKTGAKTGKSRGLYLTPILTRAYRRYFLGDAYDWVIPPRPTYSPKRTLLTIPRHPIYVFIHGRGRGGQGRGEPWPSGSRLSRSTLDARRAAIRELDQVRKRIKDGDKEVTATELARASVEIRDTGDQRMVNYLFRHTAASTLLMMGVDVSTVAELLGTSVEMINSVYGHILDRHLERAAAKLQTAGRGMIGK